MGNVRLRTPDFRVESFYSGQPFHGPLPQAIRFYYQYAPGHPSDSLVIEAFTAKANTVDPWMDRVRSAGYYTLPPQQGGYQQFTAVLDPVFPALVDTCDSLVIAFTYYSRDTNKRQSHGLCPHRPHRGAGYPGCKWRLATSLSNRSQSGNRFSIPDRIFRKPALPVARFHRARGAKWSCRQRPHPGSPPASGNLSVSVSGSGQCRCHTGNAFALTRHSATFRPETACRLPCSPLCVCLCS